MKFEFTHRINNLCIKAEAYIVPSRLAGYSIVKSIYIVDVKGPVKELSDFAENYSIHEMDLKREASIQFTALRSLNTATL